MTTLQQLQLAKSKMISRAETQRRSRCNNDRLVAPLIIVATWYLVVLLNTIMIERVHSSPPVDFFRYTSEDGNLVPIGTIYKQGTNDTQLAEKLLELIQNSTHTHDNNQADLKLTQLAWHLMERQALNYMEKRVDELKPFVDKLLVQANVSSQCQSAVSSWLDHLAKLDLWASVMWNSWGDFPPAGLFEGSFTDLGSYPGCLSIEANDVIGQPQYCMLDFQPLVPTRPRFHSILKRVLAVDEFSGQLNRADFDSEPKLGSHHTAHEFGSSRFRPNKEPTRQSGPLNSSFGYHQLHNRYNKRTSIETSPMAVPIDTSVNDFEHHNNLTIRADAMIELASRAQYFYYVKFRLGACLPSKCSQMDVQKLAQAAGQRAILQAGQVNCLKREPFKLNAHQIVAIVILTSLALVALIGTLVDLLGLKGKASHGLVDWLMLFSIWTNGKKLFVVYPNGTHSDLEVIHGLRFFSMVWVIYGHTILYTEYQAFTHFFEVVETKIASAALLPTLNANFSVDTFFVISGVLTTYVTWEFMRGDPRKFNKLAFALSRYIRLTPQLIIVILLFFLLPLTGEGPLFKQVTEYQADLCYKGWLTNLLYLQSYTDSEKLCIDPSWWLSIEMSFHLISILVISVMVRNPKRGLILNLGIATVLTAWGFFIHYSNGFAIQYLPSIPQRYEIQTEQTKLFFHRPYPHAPSYFIGTALGYLLATRSIKRLTRSQLVHGWIVCAFGLILSLWGTYFWNLGAPYTQLQATLYYHLCQILWPISIAWIIFVSSLGQGGIIHSILAAPFFAPLGRITYMTYLSHALIIYYHSACQNIPVEPSITSFIYAAISNTILALLLGVVLTLLYESPILNMQKHLVTFLTRKFDTKKPKRLEVINATTGEQQQLTIDIRINHSNGNGSSDNQKLPQHTINQNSNGNVSLNHDLERTNHKE